MTHRSLHLLPPSRTHTSNILSSKGATVTTGFHIFLCLLGFFRIWDEDTEMWLTAQFGGLFSGSSRLVELPMSLEISVSDCYRAVIDGTLAMRKNPPHVTRNHFHLLSRLSPAFFCSARSARLNHSPFPFSRNYLSELKQSEHARVAGLFCLILIIFLLSGYLEGVERWMYQ